MSTFWRRFLIGICLGATLTGLLNAGVPLVGSLVLTPLIIAAAYLVGRLIGDLVDPR